MWLDSDLIFLNDDWVPETAELLDKYPVVQPFGWMTYLPAGEGADYAVEQLASLPLGQGVANELIPRAELEGYLEATLAAA